MKRIGSRCWHPEETLADSELTRLQEARLFATVEAAYTHSKFYRRLYDEHGVCLEELASLSDVGRLPFTYPKDLMECSKEFISSSGIVAIQCSGGTTRNPKTVFRSYSDYIESSEVLSRLFYMNGIRAEDTVAILQPFGIWAIGALAFEGLRRIGATALPLGIHMNDDMVIQLLKQHNASGVFITPSNCLRLAELIQTRDMNPRKDLHIRTIVLAGEKVTPRHRKALSKVFNAGIFSLYGSEETDGLATECVFHSGLHFCADHFYLEVIDPETGEHVPPGTLGEAAITTLTKKGSPLIRYRIGDLVRLLGKKCNCRRSLPLIEIKGRSSEVLILTEGTKVYPFQVDAVLDELGVDILNYQVVRERSAEGKDILSLTVEVTPETQGVDLADKIALALRKLSVDFTDACTANLVEARVHIVGPETIQPTSRGKIVRFVDRIEA